VADLTFSQPARRNLLAPILIAVVVLGIALLLVLAFTPHKVADVTVSKPAVYASHIVFKSQTIVVGNTTAEDDLYALVTVHITDRLRLPLFLKDFTATLTPADGDPIEANAAEKPDIPNLYTTFPALKDLADQQAQPLLLRDTRIDPGQSASGIILLHFPVSQDTWNKRKSATLSIALYHQNPLVIDLPAN
jgi:hypothetical protein